MKFDTIGFVGLGLIGGSIAKTIRRIHPSMHIIAYDTDKASLTAALSDGTINQANDHLSSGFSPCQLIFLCAPVNENIKNLDILKEIVNKDCIFTDVGSVKSVIFQAVHESGLDAHFIGGHPMAGSEKSGYANADDRLLENAYYILTPADQVPQDAIDALTELVKSIDALPLILEAEQHDYIMAAISHLPHIIAYTLVNLVKDSDDPDERMRMLAAGGFKDITRIASSSPVMWQQICSENKDNLIKVLENYIQSLQHIEQNVQEGDSQELLHFFSEAKDYRDSIPVSSARGSLEGIYEIYVDLIDEAGGIATIATILATNGISIKNIGIVHNREFQEGALRIEFYDRTSVADAVVLLRKHSYVVHERN